MDWRERKVVAVAVAVTLAITVFLARGSIVALAGAVPTFFLHASGGRGRNSQAAANIQAAPVEALRRDDARKKEARSGAATARRSPVSIPAKPASTPGRDWSRMRIMDRLDPALGTLLQRKVLSDELNRMLNVVVDQCKHLWNPPRELANAQGVVVMNIELVTNLAVDSGIVRIRGGEVTSADLSDADFEECVVLEVGMIDTIKVPSSYADDLGGLRSVNPIRDGAYRVKSQIRLGKIVDRAAPR